MYCTKCGKQVEENELVCSGCNSRIIRPASVKKETPIIAILALVFSVICPPVGFLLGFTGAEIYDTAKYKTLSSRAISVSISIFAVICVATLLLFYFI